MNLERVFGVAQPPEPPLPPAKFADHMADSINHFDPARAARADDETFTIRIDGHPAVTLDGGGVAFGRRNTTSRSRQTAPLPQVQEEQSMKSIHIDYQSDFALASGQRPSSRAASDGAEPRSDTTAPTSATGTPDGDAVTQSRRVRERVIRWVEDVYTSEFAARILECCGSGDARRICCALRGIDEHVDTGLISQADVDEIFVQVAAQQNLPVYGDWDAWDLAHDEVWQEIRAKEAIEDGQEICPANPAPSDTRREFEFEDTDLPF